MSTGSAKAQLRTQLRETVATAILEAAEDLIASNGLEGAPLAQIAKRAGVAVGTLYNYFADRDALIAALFEMRRATLRPQLRAAVTAGAALGFEPRLRAFVRDAFAALDAHRKFVKVAIETEHHKLTPGTASQDISSAVTDLVKVGIKEGVVASEHAELLSVAIISAIKGLALKRISANAKLEAADADALVTLFLDGART